MKGKRPLAVWHEPIVIQRIVWLRRTKNRRRYSVKVMRKLLRRERARVLSVKFIEEVTGYEKMSHVSQQNNQKRIDEQHRKDAPHDYDD